MTSIDLDATIARHGEWYGDGESCIGPPAQWPDRDADEDKAHYIVRNDRASEASGGAACSRL